MFGSIAHRYDLANHVLSCGCDFLWRNRAAQIVAEWNPKAVVEARKIKDMHYGRFPIIYTDDFIATLLPL